MTKHIGELFVLPGFCDGWTPEQWAEHEEKARIEREAFESRRQKEIAAERRIRFLQSGFTTRALEAAESADESKPAIKRVAKWDPTKDNVLVLSGPPGCGKTVAATWWAFKSERSVRFLRASEFASSSRYDQEGRKAILGAGALVLDDLGTEYADAKGSFLVDLDELIDNFYGNRKPLIITTNSTLPEFKERYGPRVEDRIRECGVWSGVAGNSMRMRRKS